jgi:hypothetical protein
MGTNFHTEPFSRMARMNADWMHYLRIRTKGLRGCLVIAALFAIFLIKALLH